MLDSFWDSHYQEFALTKPSKFAQHCFGRVINSNDTIVELGCGNGRDGMALAKKASRYIGVDQCPIAVKRFSEIIASSELASAGRQSVQSANFATLDFNPFGVGAKRLVIYSRFSFHSITYQDADRLLDNLHRITTAPWIFALEARTIFDSLYGQGLMVGKHEFRTDHYRRFIDPNEFLAEIVKRFSVQYFELGRGFAPFEGEDPLVMRAIMQPIVQLKVSI